MPDYDLELNDDGFPVYEDANDYPCPGCGSLPGDGYTAGCDHPDGCGYFADLELSYKLSR